MADKKNKNLQQDEETVKANEAIQDEFDNDGNSKDEKSSPIPFVTNNTAPSLPEDKDNKK